MLKCLLIFKWHYPMIRKKNICFCLSKQIGFHSQTDKTGGMDIKTFHKCDKKFVQTIVLQ